MRLADPVLVTGATGFIGRRLIRRLLDEGHAPRALVLAGETLPGGWEDRVEVVRGDVTRAADARRAVEGAATVIHLAAKVGDWGTEEEHRRITVEGTEHVLGAAAASGARALLVSSIAVYGDAIGREVCHEDRPFGRPLGPYSRSKQEQERIARRLEATRGLRVSIVRPANVFGPGSVPWIDLVLVELFARRPIVVGDGRKNAGLAWVGNVVDLLVRAGAAPAAVGRVYNACDAGDVTWSRYFADLARLAGAPPPRAIPAPVARVAALGYEAIWRLLRRERRPPITREALNLVGSHHRVPIDRARAELGFAPAVGYAEAMSEVAAWVRAREAQLPSRS